MRQLEYEAIESIAVSLHSIKLDMSRLVKLLEEHRSHAATDGEVAR